MKDPNHFRPRDKKERMRHILDGIHTLLRMEKWEEGWKTGEQRGGLDCFFLDATQPVLYLMRAHVCIIARALDI